MTIIAVIALIVGAALFATALKVMKEGGGEIFVGGINNSIGIGAILYGVVGTIALGSSVAGFFLNRE